MAKLQGDIRGIQAVFDSTTNLFLGLSDPHGPGDGVDITLGLSLGDALTSSRSTTIEDNEKLLRNETTTNYSLTIVANTTPNGGAAIQISTGLVTLVAGAGVTLRGSPLQTYLANDIIMWEPSGVAPNDFVVKVA